MDNFSVVFSSCLCDGVDMVITERVNNVRRKWTTERVVKAISVFVNETGFFPSKKDFTAMKCLPHYSTFQSLNVGRNNKAIELIRARSQQNIPRFSHPHSKMLNVAEKYYMKTGFPLPLEVVNFFYVAQLGDGTKVSFFDTPIIFGHKNRWEDVKDDIIYVSPSKEKWLIENIGILAKSKKEDIDTKEEVSTLLDSLLGASY